MPLSRIAAVSVLGLRIAYGVGLLAAPARLGEPWLGEGTTAPAAQVALRGLGAREVVLHSGALAAALTGSPLRPWLAASIAGDVADIAATAAVKQGLPDRAAVKTAAVAGLSALASAAVAALVDG